MASPHQVWRVQHRTIYHYGSPARESFNEARLMPVNNEHQTVQEFTLTVNPSTPVHCYVDFCGNTVHHFDVPGPHQSLVVESRSVVAVHPASPVAQGEDTSPSLKEWADSPPATECYDYLGASRFVELEPDIWRLAIDATMDCGTMWRATMAIMRFVNSWLTYTPASTHVHTTVRDLMSQRRGVCQDYAHLMLGLCRSLKIPARYVSGYLATEGVSATHAWVEVFCPGAGWQALDPTHNQAIDHNYIKIGSGRDYADVAPVTGYYKGTRERKMDIEVMIEAE